MFDILIHKWLKIPYVLHVHTDKRPKRPRATILFIHGIGNSGGAWESVIKKLPDDVRVISIDLLGFGASPRPKWALYDAKSQATSVLATLLRIRLSSPVIVVGHSLGSLVAVEVAKRYPALISSLILCSPPFYKADTTKRLPNTDKMLKNIYSSVQKYPDQFVRLSAIAMKYNLVNRVFNVTSDNVDSYVAALEATILNQTSLEDAKKINRPMRIIRGTLDPTVIRRNLKELALSNPQVSLTQIVAGHEVKGRFVPAVVRAITETLEEK